MSKLRPFYITTPIYYVTDSPHIGHLYTTVAADIMARFHRANGEMVRFLTGTDEHGQKIEKKAKESGETPQVLADRVVERYRAAWKKFDIQYDDFIRTTEERHKKVVREFISRLMVSGDIVLGTYEGWYCIPDESYWTESQIVDGKCPECSRPLERLKEESYFFKMSKYQERLLEHIQKNSSFILPESRKNEVLSFISQGLKDISVSRTTIQWGIPMPPDSKATKEHKVYVWFDALTNYVSALDPLSGSDNYKLFWPEAVHIVGKDILRFHAVYWPTFLMALDLPLPRQIIAHGWLTDSHRKISKSVGNVVDPMKLADEFGTDGIRYFLFREFVFGLDGEYTREVVVQRINADLANDYGNSISRVCAMWFKYYGETAIETSESLRQTSPVHRAVVESVPAYRIAMGQFQYQKALEHLWVILGSINRYIEVSAPWALAKSKSEADSKKLLVTLLHCHEGLRIVSLLLTPFLPQSAVRALETLDSASSLSKEVPFSDAIWGKGPSKITLKIAAALFPRIEMKP